MKIKKIFFLFFLSIFLSCSTTKKRNVVRVTSDKRKEVRKTTELVRANEKPKTNEQNTVNSREESESLEATSNVNVTYKTVYHYIDSFKEVAKQNMQEYGIPASITLAQGILESGAGNGRLCLEANNHFGIKCHKEWNGPSITHDDDAAQECFRKYKDPAESYRDHSLFLTSRSRYKNLFALKKDDYKSWAKGLKTAGYATDPKYPSKLIGIIERYQLDQYDKEVLKGNIINNKEEVIVEEELDNDTKWYEIQKGDTLYSISKRFNISVDELKLKNGLKDNSLSIGQKIKI